MVSTMQINFGKHGRAIDEDIPTTVAPPTYTEEPMVNNRNEIKIGPITRARAKLIEQQVNSLLIDSDVLLGEDFILPKSLFICMIRYHDEDKAQGGEVQVRGEEEEQKDFGRPTRFGRPTSMVKTTLEPLQNTYERRRTSVEVRTSDMTDVRQEGLRDDP